MQKYAAHVQPGPVSEVTFPPSYVIAIDAFEEAVRSSPSKASRRESWVRDLPYVDIFIFNFGLSRKFAREEIAGLPSELHRLGVAIHMAQDLAVPHHAQGFAGLCHAELEALVDELICPPHRTVKMDLYDSGVFDQFRH